MKINCDKMISEYSKVVKRMPKNVKDEIIRIVDEMCGPIQLKSGPLVGIKFHYINQPNPIMKNTDDELLIKYFFFYRCLNGKKENSIKLFEEIERRGHQFFAKNKKIA